MIAVLQEVRLRWTKASRSGDAAAARNAARRVYGLPRLPEVRGTSQLIAHSVRLDERSGFTAAEHELRTERLGEGQVVSKPGLRIRFVEGTLRATWAWEFAVGAPERSTQPVQVVSVGPGSWGQVRINGRHSSLSGMAGWTYLEWTLNVALIPEPTLDPFSGEPSKTFESLADLR